MDGEVKTEEKTLGEVMVEQLQKINEALQELRKTGLSDKHIVYMINRKTKVPMKDIRAVLGALEETASELRAPYRG